MHAPRQSAQTPWLTDLAWGRPACTALVEPHCLLAPFCRGCCDRTPEACLDEETAATWLPEEVGRPSVWHDECTAIAERPRNAVSSTNRCLATAGPGRVGLGVLPTVLTPIATRNMQVCFPLDVRLVSCSPLLLSVASAGRSVAQKHVLGQPFCGRSSIQSTRRMSAASEGGGAHMPPPVPGEHSAAERQKLMFDGERRAAAAAARHRADPEVGGVDQAGVVSTARKDDLSVPSIPACR